MFASCSFFVIRYCHDLKAFAITDGDSFTSINTQGGTQGRDPGGTQDGTQGLYFCPLPFPSAGDRWFRACGVYGRKHRLKNENDRK